jgi:hypothetical protein
MTLQTAVTGIGVYFSSRDNGDETGGNPSMAFAATPDRPASSRGWSRSVARPVVSALTTSTGSKPAGDRQVEAATVVDGLGIRCSPCAI